MAEEPPRWEAIPEGERDRGRSHALVSGLTWALPHSASPKKRDSLEQGVFLELIPGDSARWGHLAGINPHRGVWGGIQALAGSCGILPHPHLFPVETPGWDKPSP